MSPGCIYKIDIHYLKRTSSSSIAFILANIFFSFPGVLTAHRTFSFSSQKFGACNRNMSYSTNHRFLRLEKIFKRSFRNPSGSRTNVPERNSKRGDSLPVGGFSFSYVVVA